ncbi:NADH-ubiquinone reductase complex 1 MLRQ subunit-domain-containing protein [Naematelia encephala]|uniref:NADH-ubiquinone reductase complex 1 MLRQ subunit-domain-containing protein n=1 Tax=Naematelia encephala TaxID=71784 RepID=A0A1Y2BCS6_9TREE|nr:NADH-ubiquinone reductase complex 1 MLRQ subunit-domain-containing protein [Naematelia encephala]
MAARFNFKKNLPVEVYPIVAIMGIAVGGASYYLYKLAMGNEVVWDRKGDWKPWDKIKYDQNTKFLTTQPEFWAKRKEQRLALEKERLV